MPFLKLAPHLLWSYLWLRGKCNTFSSTFHRLNSISSPNSLITIQSPPCHYRSGTCPRHLIRPFHHPPPPGFADIPPIFISRSIPFITAVNLFSPPGLVKSAISSIILIHSYLHIYTCIKKLTLTTLLIRDEISVIHVSHISCMTLLQYQNKHTFLQLHFPPVNQQV